jgi:hypothetical protein
LEGFAADTDNLFIGSSSACEVVALLGDQAEIGEREGTPTSRRRLTGLAAVAAVSRSRAVR